MAGNKKLRELAVQLRHPQGEKGIEIADMMHETNINMTLHSVSCLNIQDHDRVLELGHGNCGHLPDILGKNKEAAYFGLETSELMYREAMRINESFVQENQAFFHLYDGLYIPFPDHYFHKIFTVNTIYFWTKPEFLLSELYRVLKENGILCITFADEDFMQTLPFTRFGFELYSTEKVNKLIEKTPFQILKTSTETETIKSKTGGLTNRIFMTTALKKMKATD